MPIKPNASDWTIKEQIVEDGVSGLSIQFKVMPDGTPRLVIYGESLPCGNREIVFDENGAEAGAGTATTGLCHANWISEVV